MTDMPFDTAGHHEHGNGDDVSGTPNTDTWQKWRAAGTAFKGLAGEFAQRVKEESPLLNSGDAAKRLGDLKGSDARGTFNNVAGFAGEVVKDLAGSMKAAARDAKDSPHIDEVKASLGDAVGATRQTVESAWSRVSEDGNAEGARGIAKNVIKEFSDKADQLRESLGKTGRHAKMDGDGTADPTIIDVEIVEEDTVATAKPSDQQPPHTAS